jgi:hypothetical protein
MIRNLRILVAAAMALMALGAIGASGARAAEEFHCSVEECRLTPKTDGTPKNAHHVFIVENEAKTESVSFTCESLRGHARAVGKTFTQVTLTEITYDNCTVNGSTGVTIDMNGCDYLFTANTTLDVVCPTEKTIDLTVPGCTITIHGQTGLPGLNAANVGSVGSREVTVSTNVAVPEITVSNPCVFIKPGQKLLGTYTTGNTLVTGETEGGARADAWFQ